MKKAFLISGLLGLVVLTGCYHNAAEETVTPPTAEVTVQ